MAGSNDYLYKNPADLWFWLVNCSNGPALQM